MDDSRVGWKLSTVESNSTLQEVVEQGIGTYRCLTICQKPLAQCFVPEQPVLAVQIHVSEEASDAAKRESSRNESFGVAV